MKSFYSAPGSTRLRTTPPSDKNSSPMKGKMKTRRHSAIEQQASENGSESSSTAAMDMDEEDASFIGEEEASPGPQTEGTTDTKRRKKIKTPVPLKVCDNCSTQAVLHKAKKCHNCGKFFYDHWAKRCRIPPCPQCHFSRRSGGIKKLPTHCERCNYPLTISPCSSTSPPTGESSPDLHGDDNPLSPPPELTDNALGNEVGVARPDPIMPSVGYGSKDTPTTRSLPPLPLTASSQEGKAASLDDQTHSSGVALLRRKLGITDTSSSSTSTQETQTDSSKSSIFSAILPTPTSGNVAPFPLVPAARHREASLSSPLLEYAHSISARVYLPDEIKPDKKAKVKTQTKGRNQSPHKVKTKPTLSAKDTPSPSNEQDRKTPTTAAADKLPSPPALIPTKPQLSDESPSSSVKHTHQDSDPEQQPSSSYKPTPIISNLLQTAHTSRGVTAIRLPISHSSHTPILPRAVLLPTRPTPPLMLQPHHKYKISSGRIVSQNRLPSLAAGHHDIPPLVKVGHHDNSPTEAWMQQNKSPTQATSVIVDPTRSRDTPQEATPTSPTAARKKKRKQQIEMMEDLSGLSPVKVEPVVTKKRRRRRHKVAAEIPSHEMKGSDKGVSVGKPRLAATEGAARTSTVLMSYEEDESAAEGIILAPDISNYMIDSFTR